MGWRTKLIGSDFMDFCPAARPKWDRNLGSTPPPFLHKRYILKRVAE
jgi:hypothetical protein